MLQLLQGRIHFRRGIMSRFSDALKKNLVLIADGATGTQLQKAGLPAGIAPERWNLENPQAIINLHKSYLDAGANIVLTNTFGGSRIKLAKDNLAEKCVEINRTAAELARKAAGEGGLVFGDMGPTGELLAPLGPLTYDQAVAAFTEQAGALAEGGVDVILVETMSDLFEAKAAVEGAKKACSLPVIVTMSFDTRGRTMMGVKPATAVTELWPMGLAAIGANCGRSLTETFTAIEAMRQADPKVILMAKPNAGLPHMEGSETVFDVTPEVMAEHAIKFRDAGVKIFGGCCGSSPDHIRAAAKALQTQ
jgi:5-methyltetrahydrofolate--homocysteine methyltransferase